tara:strand:- start:2546 stop:2899 length:354 start_codon:yes stop_codon:yes gene_type:complete
MHLDEVIEKIIALIIVCLFIVPFSIGPVYENSPFYDSSTFTCSELTGVIVDKEPFFLYISVENNYTNVNENYIIYVSTKAYSNYSIGDTHTESVCTLSDYSIYKDLIESLKQSGILE